MSELDPKLEARLHALGREFAERVNNDINKEIVRLFKKYIPKRKKGKR